MTDTVTTQLSNGLTCDIPASSPLAKLLKTQRTWVGPGAKDRLAILRAAKSIAIVGASPNPARSSYFVGTYLQQSSDYRVYFVNPNADTILGQKAYASLADLPEVPDIVDVFRKASDIPSVIDDVLAVGARASPW
jgi:predicted CoA-binding protein